MIVLTAADLSTQPHSVLLNLVFTVIGSSPVKQLVPPSPAKSDTDVHNDSAHDPHFEPIIELPPEVDVVTGMLPAKSLSSGQHKVTLISLAQFPAYPV